MRRSRQRVFIAVGLLAFAPISDLAGQDPTEVSIGQRVRVSYRDSVRADAGTRVRTERLTGNVRALTQESLLIAPDAGDPTPFEIDLGLVTKLETRQQKGNARLGALLTIPGAAVGMVVGISSCDMSDETLAQAVDCSLSSSWNAALGGLVGGLAGLGIGVLVGGAIKTEQWAEVEGALAMPPVTLSLGTGVTRWSILLRLRI